MSSYSSAHLTYSSIGTLYPIWWHQASSISMCCLVFRVPRFSAWWWVSPRKLLARLLEWVRASAFRPIPCIGTWSWWWFHQPCIGKHYALVWCHWLWSQIPRTWWVPLWFVRGCSLLWCISCRSQMVLLRVSYPMPRSNGLPRSNCPIHSTVVCPTRISGVVWDEDQGWKGGKLPSAGFWNQNLHFAYILLVFAGTLA